MRNWFLVNLLVAGAAVLFLSGCDQANGERDSGVDPKVFATPYPDGPDVARAVFAGGCFWCMEPPFEKLEGVHEVVSGYTGGTGKRPAYNEVAAGRTSYVEAVEVAYDPDQISYEELLEVFWRSINPTQADGQFADRGPQYKTAIFVANESEKKAAEASIQKLQDSGKFDKPIVTEIREFDQFYPAEVYHQDYYKKNSAHYTAYYHGSGRAGFLKKTWGDE